MPYMKKTKYLLIGILVCVQLITACENNQNTANELPNSSEMRNTSKWKIGNDMTINWYLNFSSWEYGESLKDNPVLKEVSDITGVVPVVKTPSVNEDEKMDIMIATNNLPDMITMSLSDYHVKKLIQQNLVYSMDELIEKHAPGFKNEIDPELWDSTSIEDGKLYGLPSYFVPKEEYDRKAGIGNLSYNVRKDIYRELGSPNMSTPEKFLEALKAFKSKYPKIKGKQSVPVCLYGYEENQIGIIERSFGIGDYSEDQKHNLQIKYKDPKYINVVLFLNEMYREGLMDPLAFIKQHEQLEEDLSEGRVFAAPMKYSNLSKANTILDNAKPNSHYIAIEPLSAMPEVTFPGVNRLGRTITMVSKNTKIPETAIKFMRYLWSRDGNLLLNFGHEGEDYKKSGNIIQINNRVEGERANKPAGFSEKTGLNNFGFFYYPYFNIVHNFSKDEIEDRRILDRYVFDNTVYTYDMNPDPATVVGIINSRINNIIKGFYPKVIMAPSKDYMIAYFNFMLREMEKAGVKQLEEYWTEKYKINLKRFNIK